MEAKGHKALIVYLCLAVIIALLLFRFILDGNTLDRVTPELIPEFIGSLIILPIIYFLFENRGISIEDSGIQPIKNSAHEVQHPDENISVLKDQNDANKLLLKKLELKTQKVTQVEMIQYSSVYVLQLIHFFIEMRITVDLYIKNPKSAHDPLQKKKIEGSLAGFTTNVSYKKALENGKLNIYLYNPDSQIRGVKADSSLIIGNYLYTDEVHGEDNFAVLFSDPSDFRYKSALNTFNLQLEYLRKNSLRWVPPSEVLPKSKS